MATQYVGGLMSDLESLLKQLPVSVSADQVQLLSGGSVNQSWKISRTEGDLVLRQDGPLVAELGLNRRAEMQVLHVLAQHGLGPEVVWADPDAGLLLTRFIDGQHWDRRSLEISSDLDKLFVALVRLHSIGTSESAPVMEYAATAEHYATLLGGEEARLLARDAARLAAEWCADKSRYVLCHNDLSAGNVIERPGGDLHFIDWEYAAWGEPCFDLAGLIQQSDEGDGPSRSLLEAAYAFADPQRLDGCRALYDRLAALWLIWVCARSSAPESYQAARDAVLGRIKP